MSPLEYPAGRFFLKEGVQATTPISRKQARVYVFDRSLRKGNRIRVEKNFFFLVFLLLQIPNLKHPIQDNTKISKYK
jgi:hypothetical protein